MTVRNGYHRHGKYRHDAVGIGRNGFRKEKLVSETEIGHEQSNLQGLAAHRTQAGRLSARHAPAQRKRVNASFAGNVAVRRWELFGAGQWEYQPDFKGL